MARQIGLPERRLTRGVRVRLARLLSCGEFGPPVAGMIVVVVVAVDGEGGGDVDV